MLCDGNLNAVLSSRDVHETKIKSYIAEEQDGFALQEPSIVQSCQDDVFNATETFCTIPGAFGDNGMCALNLQTGDPNAFFERLVRGEIQHPDDMVAIWESAFFENNLANDVASQPWVTVREDATHTDLKNGDYAGFRSVQNSDTLDISVSNNCNVFMLVEGGQLYQNESDGLLHSVQGIRGANNPLQKGSVSSSGRVRVVMFTDAFFLFVNNEWKSPNISVPNGTKFKSILLWEVGTFVYVAVFSTTATNWILQIFRFFDSTTNDLLVALDPWAQVGQQNNNGFQLMFLTITPDNQHILCGTVQGTIGEQMRIHFFDANNPAVGPQYNRWSIVDHNIAVFLEVASPFIFRPDCITNGSLAPSEGISIYTTWERNTNRMSTLRFVLNGNNTVSNYVFTEEFSVTYIRMYENIYHTRRLLVYRGKLYASSNLVAPLIITNQNAMFSLEDGKTPYVFAISPDGLDAFIYRNGILFRLHSPLSPTSVWTRDFNLYPADRLKIHDAGLPPDQLDPAVFVPGMKWFLGSKTLGKEPGVATQFPIESGRSPHETFRYELQAPRQQLSPVKTFLYAVASLQRANEYALALQLGVTVRLANDGAVTFENANGNFIWQSHTHDRASSRPEEFQTLDLQNPPFAISSPNGLYILYMSNSGGSGQARMRLVNNSFNNARFARWCALNSERFGKAIDIHSNFCWNALKIARAGSVDFVDQRCSCIGGERLFRIIAPNADKVHENLLAPLQQNLPCVAGNCLQSFANDDDLNNVSNYYAQRCGGRVFNICQQAFTIGADTQLVNVDLLRFQDCSGLVSLTCKTNNQCGPGMTCFNGRCVSSCTTDEQCQNFTGSTINMHCDQGRCQQQQRSNKRSIDLFTLLAIFAAMIFVVLMCLLIGLFARAKKNARKKINK